MAQQIPLTFSEVLNLPSLGVSANAIKFGVSTRVIFSSPDAAAARDCERSCARGPDAT